MLFQIQKELVHQRNINVILTVERDFSQYQKLKKEYLRLSEGVKNKLTSKFKIFLLLTSLYYADVLFAEKLVQSHDYEAMEDSDANLALGRFYGKYGGLFKKNAIKHFLALFEEEKLGIADLATLFTVLFENADHKTCRKIIGYVQAHHNEHLGWNIEILTYQIRMKHLYPNNEKLILDNLKLLYPRCETDGEYIRMAACCFEAGYINDAIALFNISLQKVIPVQQHFSVKSKFNSSNCFDSMNEIVDILEAENIKPFPAFGSLLGLVRDGKFMDYDKDADLGIFVNNYDEVHRIVSILCQELKFTSPGMINNSKESHMWNVGIFDTQRIVAIDLFFFYHNQNHIETGIYSTCAVLKWAFEPFELVRGSLAGKEYWLPNNTEKHLTELYENWREPVEVWDSLINCPNLIKSSRPQVLYYGLLRLYNAMADGKTKKVLNYYETLTNRWGMQISPEASANIHKLLSENN
jgi:hypothetical protein